MKRDFIDRFPTTNKDRRFVHNLIGITLEATELQPEWNMAHVMVHAGVFSSTSQAKKAGWNIPIPDGFSQHTVGQKNKRKISILKGW